MVFGRHNRGRSGKFSKNDDTPIANALRQQIADAEALATTVQAVRVSRTEHCHIFRKRLALRNTNRKKGERLKQK